MSPATLIPTGDVAKLLGRVQVNIPFPMLWKNLDPILQIGIHPEIYFSSQVLDRLPWEDVETAAQKLRRKGVSVTFHAPFMDLNPGAVDEKIREVTAYRFGQVMDLVPHFRPKTIVFHPGYDRFCYDGDVDLWLERSLLTWRPLVEQAGKQSVRLAVENVFEESPAILKRLFSTLDSPNVGYCLDAGHGHLFSEAPLEKWIEELAPWLIETHLHDNHGAMDDHLPVGQGRIDFAAIFAAFRKNKLQPIYTVEPHQVEHLEPTLRGLAPYLQE